MSPTSPTRALAEFSAGLASAEIPATVREAARAVILDGLAVAVAGASQPVATIVRDYLNEYGGRPDSRLLGGGRVPAPAAAFGNGVAMHCLDYEVQGYPSAHGTSSILPALLAVAESEALSGEDLVTAFVVGWDVQQRLRAAGEHGDMRGLHPPGVVGPVGAAAAVARLRGLDADTTSTVLGIAASRAAGLFANNGTMTKATHPAAAARAGVESVDLAQRGLSSNQEILEDPRGFARAMFGGQFDVELLLAGLGTTFHLVDPGINFKRFPAEIFMQWPIEAMINLKARESLSWRDVEEIVVEPPVFRADLSRPRPRSELDGKFSYEYCVTVALTEDHVGIAAYSDDVLESERVQATLPRVRLVHNPDIPADKTRTWATVSVTTTDGRSVSETCRAYTGSMTNPMPRSVRVAKAEDALRTQFSVERTAAVIAAVEGLDDAPDAGALMRLVCEE